MKRYGFDDAAGRIAAALFDVPPAPATTGCRSSTAASTDRGASVVAYPVACIPQAWAAATPLLLLQTMLEDR